MPITIRIIVIALSLLLFIYTMRLVLKKRLQLKYSLIWVFCSLIALICGIFPGIVIACSDVLHFVSPSNLVFLVAVFFMLAVALSLSVIVSWQSDYIKSLVQEVALLNKRIDDIEKR